MADTGWFVDIDDPLYFARIIIGSGPIESHNSVDVHLRLPDGSGWACTFYSLEGVGASLENLAHEMNHPFLADPSMVVLPQLSVVGIRHAATLLVAEGQLHRVFESSSWTTEDFH